MLQRLVEHVTVNHDEVSDIFDCIKRNGDCLIFNLEAGSIKGRIRADNKAQKLPGRSIERDVFNLPDNFTVGTHDTLPADIVGELFALHNIIYLGYLTIYRFVS